ncbi:hypothetical protein JYU34_008623 [Plutella xylostella]|uniref:Uncharacterized protein n=1 Tax=Plutella xylostella TaxID=51655 RepID=A0ABQ7QLE4_PLUXY|nr:hypothetical protein JYU34_008623 [Plutella xylostella]
MARILHESQQAACVREDAQAQLGVRVRGRRTQLNHKIYKHLKDVVKDSELNKQGWVDRVKSLKKPYDGVWRRLWSGGGGEHPEDPRAELPADTRQLVYNVYVYFTRRPGRSAKAALTKTASATMLPRDIVADIIRDKHRDDSSKHSDSMY